MEERKKYKIYKITCIILSILLIAAIFFIIYKVTYKEDKEYFQLDKIDEINLNIESDKSCIIESYRIILKNKSHDFRIYIIKGDGDITTTTNHNLSKNISDNDSLIDCYGETEIFLTITIQNWGLLDFSVDCYTQLNDGVVYFYKDKKCTEPILATQTTTRFSDNETLTFSFSLNANTTYNRY